MKILVDTNVFLRFVAADSPEFAECDAALEAITHSPHTACCCAQVLIEFWGVATRPTDVNGLGMSVADVEHEIDDIRTTLDCLPEPADMAERWSKLASRYSVMGRQVHDARLAALMVAPGVTHLLTLNPSDFTRYQEITPVTPQEAIQQFGIA